MIFKIATTRNMPTPSPTVIISSHLLTSPSPGIMSLTWSASTDKSGSATVISKPIIKQTERSIPTFFDFVRPEPTCPPIGVIARSAPRLKRPIPRISNTAETANAIVSTGCKSTSGVNEIISTITVTGNTDIKDSLSFENSALNIF